MLKTETVTYHGTEYIRTWSDTGVMIERDGAMYEEAIDPVDSGRTYTETETPIHTDDLEAEEAGYLAALFERYGVLEVTE